MKAVPIFQVDAFADEPFGGNPAGVCILPVKKSELWMQNIAREMNLSETAFLFKQKSHFNLRWFTPVTEVELCGHATLASAHILYQFGHLKPDEPARFQTLSGLLSAEKEGKVIVLDFPAAPERSASMPAGLKEALGITPKYVGINKFDYLLELNSESEVINLQPDFERLKQVQSRGIIMTAHADGEKYDFVSRFFAPAVGINEDPVTGSAHCCLGPFWSKKLDKKILTGYQASERGGVVRIEMKENRVRLGGTAVTILKGEVLV
jgi:PhzF family phenazine biosynthesis protein